VSARHTRPKRERQGGARRSGSGQPGASRPAQRRLATVNVVGTGPTTPSNSPCSDVGWFRNRPGERELAPKLAAALLQLGACLH
jgi:hypothetical protein